MKDNLYEVIQHASNDMGVFGHGYTWGGHPVACAVALKTLEIYKRDNIFEHAARLYQRSRRVLGSFLIIH